MVYIEEINDFLFKNSLKVQQVVYVIYCLYLKSMFLMTF